MQMAILCILRGAALTHLFKTFFMLATTIPLDETDGFLSLESLLSHSISGHHALKLLRMIPNPAARCKGKVWEIATFFRLGSTMRDFAESFAAILQYHVRLMPALVKVSISGRIRRNALFAPAQNANAPGWTKRDEMKKTLAKAIKEMQVKSWEMRERSAGLVPGEALGQGSGDLWPEGQVTFGGRVRLHFGGRSGDPPPPTQTCRRA